MNKSCLTGCTLLTSVLTCALTASTLAAPYRDAQAGYQVELPAQHLQIAGPSFLYSGDSGAQIPELQKQEKDFNMVVALEPQAVNKLLAHKFTTREFNKTWSDIQLLERAVTTVTHDAVCSTSPQVAQRWCDAAVKRGAA